MVILGNKEGRNSTSRNLKVSKSKFKQRKFV